jgi:phosphoribosylformylglycinamidine synthase
MDMDVPPTLVSFAVAPGEAEQIVSPEFKTPGSPVYLFLPGETLKDTKKMWRRFYRHIKSGSVKSAWALTEGGAAEGIFKMAVGNEIGFQAHDNLDPELLFQALSGAVDC